MVHSDRTNHAYLDPTISDPSLNGLLQYPNDLDWPLNETVTDKIRQYLFDYNKRPSPRLSPFFILLEMNTHRIEYIKVPISPLHYRVRDFHL